MMIMVRGSGDSEIKDCPVHTDHCIETIAGGGPPPLATRFNNLPLSKSFQYGTPAEVASRLGDGMRYSADVSIKEVHYLVLVRMLDRHLLAGVDLPGRPFMT